MIIKNENFLNLNFSQFHVWNKTKGKIVLTLGLEPVEIVTKIFCTESQAIVVSKLDNQTFRLRYFLIKIDKTVQMDEKLRKEFTNIDQIKVKFDNQKKELFLIINSNGKLNIITLNLNEINLQFCNQNINLSQISIESFNLSIKNSTITFQNKHLALCHDQSLYLFDISNGTLLNSNNFQQLSMNIDYFLNPSSMPLTNFKSISSIEMSDSLIILDNNGNIYFVEFVTKTNQFKSFRSKGFIFESFSLNKDKLIGCDLVNFKLVCFDLSKVSQNGTFNNSFFTIDFHKSKNIQHYGLNFSNQFIYLIENKKYLRFFNITNDSNKFNAEQTASLTLIAQVTSVLCSNEFISFSIKDRKVISFLISHKDNQDKMNKYIEKLEHFGTLDKEKEEKNNLIIKQCTTVFDNSSDDSDLEEILNDSKQFKKRFLKGTVKNYYFFIYFLFVRHTNHDSIKVIF